MAREREKLTKEQQEDCSCPACGSSDFDGYCGWCKHKASKGENWYSGEPVILKKEITAEQQQELSSLLTEDILARYDNIEYWEPDITMEFYHDNNIQQ